MTGTRRPSPRGCGGDRTRTPRRSCSRRRSPRPGARAGASSPSAGPARAWLFGIAQHLLFGYYRRLEVEDRARRRLGVVLEPALDDDADARLDAAALRAELSARLARLPDGTREAVLLRVVEQLDYHELARRLGCSNTAARLRVSRGLRELRREPSVSASLEGAVS